MFLMQIQRRLSFISALPHGPDAGARGERRLLGRSWIYALAAEGEVGISHMLQLIEAEMRVAMALISRRSMADIGPGGLVPPLRT